MCIGMAHVAKWRGGGVEDGEFTCNPYILGLHWVSIHVGIWNYTRVQFQNIEECSGVNVTPLSCQILSVAIQEKYFTNLSNIYLQGWGQS